MTRQYLSENSSNYRTDIYGTQTIQILRTILIESQNGSIDKLDTNIYSFNKTFFLTKKKKEQNNKSIA